MKQREAVVEVLEKHGGYAKLSTLRDELLGNSNFITTAKDPFANIRRIVQTTPKHIYIIKPGLYGLVKDKKKLEDKGLIQLTEKNKDSNEILQFSHSYYQGLLVEIGNLENFNTFVPHQDQNKLCYSTNGEYLKDIITKKDLEGPIKLIDRAKTIDVIWLNENDTPSNVFEVEHSTNIINSLNKFGELKGFDTKCVIVADERRREEYNKIISQNVYKNINSQFLSYQNLEKYYDKITEYHSIRNLIGF